LVIGQETVRMSPTLASLVVGLGLAGVGGGEFGYKQVPPLVLDQEKKTAPDIWVLEFTFRKPRYIMAEIPGKGRKLVWYMTYRIVNRSEEERTFVPQFTLVTEDGTAYNDVILPRAEKAVIALEDPTMTLHNSVTIAGSPLAPTPKESVDNARNGVAFWEDVDMKSKRFSIYVTGLSNGYVKVTDKDDAAKVEMRRKTLRLDFEKLGDEFNPTAKEIRFVGEPAWIYR